MIERTLINTLDEIIYISDLHTHELLYANDYAKNLFIKQDYQGEKCYTMIHGETKPCSFCTNAYLKKDVFYTWEHTNTLLGRHFILKDTLIDWQGKPARLEIALDITQRENISQSIQKKLEIESALIECIRLLTTAKTLNEAMDTVLCRIGKFYNAQRAYILELDKTSTKGSNTYEWCAPGIPSQMKYLKKAPLSKLPFWQDAVKNKKNIVIFDI